MHARTLTLALAASLLAAALAQGQDYGGLYAIRGKDSQGNDVLGWLRISPEGQLDRTVQAGARRDRTVGVSEVEGGAKRAVFRYRKTSKAGLAGVLGGSESRGKTAEELTVTWSAEGAVQVDYVQGSYSSREEGSRAYDLRTLRDEAGQNSRTHLDVAVNGTQVGVLEFEHRRNPGLTQEQRRYAKFLWQGKSLVEPGTLQRLRRAGPMAPWTPEDGSQALKTNQLAKSSYKPVGITSEMPQVPVAVGATWPVAPKLMQDMLSLPALPIGAVTGTLVSVHPTEGGLRYEVRLDYALDVDYSASPDPEAQGIEGPVHFVGQVTFTQGPRDHEAAMTQTVSGSVGGTPFSQEVTSVYALEERR